MIHGTALIPMLLAQNEAWRTDGPRPPRLSGGGSPIDILFEQPLLPAAAVLFIGLVLFFLLDRSQHRRWAIAAALAAVVFAAVIYAAGQMVQTDREQVKQRTTALIRAVEGADMTAIEEMLAPGSTGAYYGRDVVAPREALVARLDEALQRYPITSARISTLEAALPLKGAAQTRSRVVVRVPEATLYDVPTALWFLIDWRTDESGAWLATRIELEMIEGPGQWERVRP